MGEGALKFVEYNDPICILLIPEQGIHLECGAGLLMLLYNLETTCSIHHPLTNVSEGHRKDICH